MVRLSSKGRSRRSAAGRSSGSVSGGGLLRPSTVEGETTIARLVTNGRPPADAQSSERMLFAALSQRWPRGARSRFLLLPGGFVSAEWPTRWTGQCGWASRARDVALLMEQASRELHRVITARVLREARGKIDSIAVGIDIARDAATGAYAELAALYDVRTRSFQLTGKSLPRSDQRTLVRVVDLGSHFIRAGKERVLVLGCHDLNFFSPRGRSRQAKGGHLELLREEMDERVQRFRPTVVLQLPHGTDTPRTWLPAWNALVRSSPSIRAWASSISYFNINDESPRATLDDVLVATYGGEKCMDLICG